MAAAIGRNARRGVSEEQGAYNAETPRFGMVGEQIIFDTRVTPAMLRVYAALALYADRDGRCWPSQRTLAKRLGRSRSTIIEEINQLVALGYLLKLSQKRDDGGKGACAYRLITPAIPPMSGEPTYPPCRVSRLSHVGPADTPMSGEPTSLTDQYRTDAVEHTKPEDSANALHASADADDAPPVAESATTTPPSYSPEPVATTDGMAIRQHKKPAKVAKYSGEEQAYVRQLVEGVCAFNHIKSKLPNHDAERGAAHWFYTANDGEPASVEDVMACYRATKHARFWQGKYLSLRYLEGCYTQWRLNPEAYTREQTQEGARNGTTERTGHQAGEAATRTAARAPTSFAVEPDYRRDGKYAAFVDGD